jgi:flavin reductase (DIM6/NTAB) family NADH-FMN oxidoreductase RutF
MKESLGAKTILYPTPVLAVGTYDREGRPNVMISAWGGICCSSPPCVAISLRQATYTYENLMASGAFTVSIPSESQIRLADYCGTVSGRSVDKFAQTGLTPVPSELVKAPYVKEFPLVLECKVIRTIEIGLHTQFIGEVLDVKVDEEYLSSSGQPDVERIRPFWFAPTTSAYYGLGAYLGQAFSIGKDIQEESS